MIQSLKVNTANPSLDKALQRYINVVTNYRRGHTVCINNSLTLKVQIGNMPNKWGNADEAKP